MVTFCTASKPLAMVGKTSSVEVQFCREALATNSSANPVASSIPSAMALSKAESSEFCISDSWGSVTHKQAGPQRGTLRTCPSSASKDLWTCVAGVPQPDLGFGGFIRGGVGGDGPFENSSGKGLVTPSCFGCLGIDLPIDI